MADAESRRVTLTAHIDTVVLRALVDEEDDKDLRVGATRLVNSGKEPKLLVCHVVVGETFERLCAEHDVGRCVAALGNFHRLIRSGKLGIENASDPALLSMHIAKLHEEDTCITQNDLVILANALACEACERFYTTDMILLYSTKVSAYARGYGTEIKQVPMREDWAKLPRGYRVKR